jgi:hypothetical protein
MNYPITVLEDKLKELELDDCFAINNTDEIAELKEAIENLKNKIPRIEIQGINKPNYAAFT